MKKLIWAPLSLLLMLTVSCNLKLPALSSPTPVPVEWIIAATFTAIAELNQATPAPAQAPTNDTAPVPATVESPAQPTEDYSEPVPTVQPTELPAEPQTPQELRLVYVKDGNIWLWTEAGGGLALTTSGGVLDVDLSPDGLIAAFTRQVGADNAELWAVNTDGSEERRLANTADIATLTSGQTDPNVLAREPYNFVWVPASHTLAFNTREVVEGPGLILSDDLWVVDADRSEISALLPPGQGGEFVISPDGSQVALATPNQISLVNIDGSNRRDSLLTFSPVSTYSESQYYPTPVWAPDSQSLQVVILPADSVGTPDQPSVIWRIPTDGSPAVQVSSIPAGVLPWAEPVLSPDLNRVAYLRQVQNPAQNQRELHIPLSDGSSDGVYYAGPLLEFDRWSPNSSRFTFVVDENRQMYVGQLGGGSAPLTADPAFISEVRWVDANRILYLQASGDGYAIHLDSLGSPGIVVDVISGAPPSFDFVY